MIDALKPILKLVKIAFILGIIAYPITGIIQFLSPNAGDPFTQYNHLISIFWSDYLYKYGDWVIVAVISYYLLHGSDIHFIETAETIRKNRFWSEIKRWRDTPYIAPLHLYYLVCPPLPYDTSAKSVSSHPLYREVTNTFRDRATIDAKYSNFEPLPEANRIKIVGKNVWFAFFICILVLVAMIVVLGYCKPIETWFSSWDKFMIPFLLFLSVRAGRIMQAMVEVGSGRRIKQSIIDYFGDENQRITWRDVFPDTPLGDAILKAWKSDCERRQRAYYDFNNVVPPRIMVFDNPACAIRPFETDELPTWTEDMELRYQQELIHWQQKNKKQQLKQSNTNGNKVVEFKKKKS
ncbi:hypothetical protein [Paenibacillus sp. FSL P4-0288]|uniref:hypothetical protein n=1 Tax=Paenibacillus sp. FSL P4-0288 TaxID=2921633 RepID=UPI0030F7124B